MSIYILVIAHLFYIVNEFFLYSINNSVINFNEKKYVAYLFYDTIDIFVAIKETYFLEVKKSLRNFYDGYQ